MGFAISRLAAFGALALACAALSSSVARADSASSSPDKPAIADVVRLKDGSIYRGTITELVPDDHVNMLLPSGATRDFKMAEVAYAGPASKDPSTTADKPSSAERRREPSEGEESERGAAVHFTANFPHIQILWRVAQSEFEGMGSFGGKGLVVFGGSREYRVLCTAPCEASLPPGEHRLALSLDGGRAVEASDFVVVNGAMALKATYNSNGAIRGIGVVVLTLGCLGGLLLTLGAVHGGNNTTPPDNGLLTLGLSVSAISFLAGLGMVLVRDSATFDTAQNEATRRMNEARAKKKTAWLTPSLTADGFRLVF